MPKQGTEKFINNLQLFKVKNIYITPQDILNYIAKHENTKRTQ